MKERKKLLTYTVLCGIVAAIEVVVLALSSVFSTLDLTLAALTVFFTYFILIEIGKKGAFSVYAVTSVLALILQGNKFTAVCYVLFFGIYPIIRSVLERPKRRIFSVLLKLGYFSAAYTAIYFLSVKLLMLEGIAPMLSPAFWITGALGVAAFFLLDIAMGMLVTVYVFKLRKRLGIDKLLKK